MTLTPQTLDQSPQLKRLLEQVERRQLHRGSRFATPREWLVNWLATPFDDLNGRKPASYLEDENFDLILVGLLGHLEPEMRRPDHARAVVTALRHWH
jgi:hypothetical protein